jgi:uncharacterized protein (TIGR00369 family)
MMAYEEKLLFNADEILAFLNDVWPEGLRRWTIQTLTPTFARVREPTSAADLRPGGTVSGPTLMKLVDAAAYIMVLGRLGRAALAVTSSLQIDFLRRPTVGELIADVDLVKMGRSLAVMNVRLYSVEAGAEPDTAKPVASSSVTYSLSLV